MALLSVFGEPSGLNVNSLLLRVENLAYSEVAIKLVALAPMAKIPATANTPITFPKSLNSLFLTAITI